jgi:hypothetical protein
MSDDAILDRLTPITAEPVAAHPSGRSRAERARMTQKRESNRADYNPHVAVSAAVKTLKANGTLGLRAPLTLDEQVRMASTLVSQFFGEAQGETSSGERMNANSRKQAAVAFGVVTDKLAMLQGRPTQILRVEEAETQRPAVLELVRKLAGAREQRPAGENAK